MILFSFRYRWWARGEVLLISLIGAIAGLAGPLFQKIFVDGILGTNDLANMRLESLHDISPVAAIVIAFVFTLIAQALMLLANYAAVREGTHLQEYLSEHLYKKMLSIRPDSLGQTTVGEVVSLYATDIAGSTAMIDQALPMAAGIIFQLVFAPLAVYWITGIPLWATLLVMIVLMAITISMATRQSRFFTIYKQLGAERTGIVNEWVQTIRMLRILGWIEKFEDKIFAKRIEETQHRVRMVTNGQLMNSFGSSINFIINITAVATLVYMKPGAIAPGELFAMLWIFGIFLSRSFRQLPWLFTFFFDSVTSMKRVQEFLARPSDAGAVESLPDPELHRPAQSLSVRGLNLKINGQTILDNLNFDVKAGEFIAIVGEVGSGKSTTLLSLVGEMGATFERFEVNGKDMRALDVNKRRQTFAFVPQEGFVMSATLRENIVFQYEAPKTEDEHVKHSLALAQIRLSEIQGPGLETEIGERGVNLSGGQRQRVSIARANEFDRPIILLDDCLSAVDVDTERGLVNDLLRGAWKDRTRILVTHRLSVLNHVDRVMLIDEGRIVDFGSFEELMKRSAAMQVFVSLVANEKSKDLSGKEAQDGKGSIGDIVESVEGEERSSEQAGSESAKIESLP